MGSDTAPIRELCVHVARDFSDSQLGGAAARVEVVDDTSVYRDDTWRLWKTVKARYGRKGVTSLRRRGRCMAWEDARDELIMTALETLGNYPCTVTPPQTLRGAGRCIFMLVPPARTVERRCIPRSPHDVRAAHHGCDTARSQARGSADVDEIAESVDACVVGRK